MVQLCVFTPRSKCVHVPDWNNKSRQSWGLVVGGGRWADASQIHLETESRWSSGQCRCQESFLSLLISAFLFSPCWCFNNDSAHRRGPSKLGGLGTPEIWTGLCSNCSSHPEIWSSTQKHWCALIVYGHFRFFQALKCTCDVDSVVFLCDTNLFSGFLTSFHNPLMIRHMTDAFREQHWKWGMRINVV